MPPGGPLDLDVVIFGGGASGLWLLDGLVRRGHRVLLLEAGDLGSGQTVASQGIIHGGLKYALRGLLSASARSIRTMPGVWRRCIAGEDAPDLTGTRLRAEFCHLWRTDTFASRLAMAGARAGLRVAPVPLEPHARPEVLARCPGMVARLDEQVIEPVSFLALLADRHADRILRIDAASGLEFAAAGGGGGGDAPLVRLINPDSGAPADLRAHRIVLAAGAGNADLREKLGLDAAAMQRRPLHMVVVRGELPPLNGHCIDGGQVRVTITSTRDFAGRVVWQVGGRVAEAGIDLDPAALVTMADRELRAVIPGLDLTGSAWSTYRVDRAEAATDRRRRPDDIFVRREGPVVTAWPTKLALVPRLAERIEEELAPPAPGTAGYVDAVARWPRPAVAAPPWEEQEQWTTDVSAVTTSS
ncbi:MAG: NAD(P)/FAD-dependent oxidoreductase [Planctomycetota bacterium]|jgi:glycerol-3-phosphate dehydrogenase